MELYHGSTRIVDRPAYGIGRSNNDYGTGFYCTQDLALAMEWACKEETTEAYVNKYELDLSSLKTVRLEQPEYNILNWLALLVANRRFETLEGLALSAKRYLLDNFLPDLSAADVVVGYRADDSYFAFAKAFISNTISLDQLSRAMRLGVLGEQVVLKSHAAFEALFFLCYCRVPYEEFFVKKCSRDSSARAAYRDLSGEIVRDDSIFFIDIIRQGWKNDDTRLR